MKKLLLFIFIICLIFIGCESKPIKRELIAFNNGSQINGNLFLGTGTIKEQFVYKYLYEQNKGIKMDYFVARRSIVYELDKIIKPYVIIIGGS